MTLFDTGRFETARSRARRAPKQLTASDVLAKGPIFQVAYGSSLFLYRADYEVQAHAKFLAEHFDWQSGENGKLSKRLAPPELDEVVVRRCTPEDVERLLSVDPTAVKRVMRG